MCVCAAGWSAAFLTRNEHRHGTTVLPEETLVVLDSSRICAPSSHWACVVTNCSMLGQAELTSLKKYDGGGEEGGGDGDGGGD